MSDGILLRAARQLGAALAESEEYRVMKAAERAMQSDAEAMAAISAVQKYQESLGWQLETGLLTDEQRAELQRLQDAMIAQPAVRRYMEAQQRFMELCQEAAALVSSQVGLDITAGLGGGCCG